MEVKMELWHLITLLLAFFGSVAAFGKVLLDQVEKRLQERFIAQDRAREAGQAALRETFNAHIEEERRNSQALQALERDLLNFKSELPINYVRRDDYVRGQAVIEAKLDSVYSKLEAILFKGGQHA